MKTHKLSPVIRTPPACRLIIFPDCETVCLIVTKIKEFYHGKLVEIILLLIPTNSWGKNVEVKRLLTSIYYDENA